MLFRSARLGIDIQKHRTEMEATQLAEGAKMGLEIARTREQMDREDARVASQSKESKPKE